MNRPLRTLTALCFAACVLAAGGRCPAEPALEIYDRPAPVVSGERLYLFAALKHVPGTPAICVRRDAGGRWERVAELSADYTCAAATDDRLYLFLPDSVVELDPETCRKTGAVRWPFNWRAQSVVFVDGKMTVFGVSGGQVYSATPAGEGSGPTDQWSEQAISVDGQGRCSQTRAVHAGGKTWLFWTTRDKARDAETLWAAELVGGALGHAEKLDSMSGQAGLAAVPSDGKPMIVYVGLPQRLHGGTVIQYRTREGARWLAANQIRTVTNPLFERTLTLSGAAAGPNVHLFLGTDHRVLGTTFDGTAWTPARTVLGSADVDWLLDHMPLLLVVLGGAAVLFVLSLIRSRLLPRRAVIGGMEYRFASWWQRAGAYLGDFFLAFLAVRAIHALLGVTPNAATARVAMFCFEMIYLTAFEARLGKTPGKWVFGIMTVSRNGGYASWGQAALRNLPRALVDSLSFGPSWLALLMPVWTFVAMITILNSRRSQRPGDMAAGTHVVREHKTR